MGEILNDDLIRDLIKYTVVYLLTALTSAISILVKMYFDVRDLKKHVNNAFKAIRRVESDYGRHSENFRKIISRADYREVFQKDDCSSPGSGSEED